MTESRSSPALSAVPLAERMRPRALDEVVGQKILDPGQPLRLLIDNGLPPSMVFWGPPGAGKTTLARLVTQDAGYHFVEFSAVLSGVKDVRQAVKDAEARMHEQNLGTVLFVDEIHRFNKAQQDAFLPHVEDGRFILIGATTENPSFHLNAALLSRAQLFILDELSTEALIAIARCAMTDEVRGLGKSGISLDDEALELLARTSHGDARSLLNRLEFAVAAALAADPGARTLIPSTLEPFLVDKPTAHDRDGDLHYGLISALHKSVRGGDPQATLYYLGRMMSGGEDPLYILRRLVRMAVEDVGLADPNALTVANGAVQAYRFLGSPEGDLVLAHAAVYLATAPKSNSVYSAFGHVQRVLRQGGVYPPPLHLRNAPTRMMKDLGYGQGYRYPFDYPNSVADQALLPDALTGVEWYTPSPFGHEKEIRKRMDWWRGILKKQQEQASE